MALLSDPSWRIGYRGSPSMRHDDRRRAGDGAAVAERHRVRPALAVQALSLLLIGLGFYMLHDSIPAFSSELSETARVQQRCRCIAFCFHGADPSARSPTASACCTSQSRRRRRLSGVVLAILGVVCALAAAARSRRRMPVTSPCSSATPASLSPDGRGQWRAGRLSSCRAQRSSRSVACRRTWSEASAASALSVSVWP